MKYRLKCENENLWLTGETGIGPRYTDKESEAMTFSSSEEAFQHPAYNHPLSMLVAEKVPRKRKTSNAKPKRRSS